MIDSVATIPSLSSEEQVEGSGELGGPGRFVSFLGLPFRTLSAFLDLLLSARGLAIIFLAVAAFLSISGWLRPPLSRDISPLYLSLGIRGKTADQPPQLDSRPEELFLGQDHIPRHSAGILLLGLIGLGTIVAMIQPQRLGMVAGILLAVGMMINAAAAFNHPLLIQALDYEFEQRQQIVGALAARYDNTVTTPANGRISRKTQPDGTGQRGDLSRGLVYLLYGRWFLLWTALGTILASRGTMPRRLGLLGTYGLLGLAGAGGLCYRRFYAEFEFARAERLESQGRFAAAREILEKAVAGFPSFEQLERTWLLTGKLDFIEKKGTAQESYFRANQLVHANNTRYQSSPNEDAPWEVARTRLVYEPKKNLDIVDEERRQALAIMEGLLADPRNFAHRPLVNQAARLWNEVGLIYFQHAAELTAIGPDKHWRDIHLNAAEESFRKAWQVDPLRRDTGFYLGLVMARTAYGHPELVEAELKPVYAGLADQVLKAEIFSTIGDAYFEAGRIDEARQWYAQSYDAFCLPKIINYRGQKGIGGL